MAWKSRGKIDRPHASVVIPVYNESACVADCVESLKRQDFKPLEIIAVDDGSTDGSAEICERLGIKVLKQDHKGPGAARNLGTRSAQGNILILIDADMVFDPDYVSKLAAPVIAGEVLATCHWNERVANWENPWARCETWFSGKPDGRRDPLDYPEEQHVYRAVRKDFLLEQGGFPENAGRSDDTLIARRTGVFSRAVPDAVCYHRNAASLGEVYADAVWRGRGVAAEAGENADAAATALAHRNPIYDILLGLKLAATKLEPRMIPYSIAFTSGFVVGVFSGVHTGSYAK